MVELETVLMPMTFNAGARERFLGVQQLLSDARPLLGRSITFESLVASSLVREGGSPPAEAPPPGSARKVNSRTSRGAHLTLVVSQTNPRAGRDQLRFDGNDALAALLAQCDAEHGMRFTNN
jgi:hypothetical protein